MVRSGIAAALFLLLPSLGYAQTVSLQPTPQSVVGFVGGGSIDPEQAFVGVFWQTPPIANRFHFRPGVDGGFGSDLRVATFNIDFIARFPLGTSGWELVQGGGPVIALTKVDGFDGTETSAGGSYIFGFAHRGGFFGEFRIGGGNVPNLKMGVGYGLKF
jgi:hypothetical protein